MSDRLLAFALFAALCASLNAVGLILALDGSHRKWKLLGTALAVAGALGAGAFWLVCRQV